MYDPHEPTHNGRYQRLYATGYDTVPNPELYPMCEECHELPAVLDADNDAPGLCLRCEEVESLEGADEYMALAMIGEGPLAP